jgi:hypothetical protein
VFHCFFLTPVSFLVFWFFFVFFCLPYYHRDCCCDCWAGWLPQCNPEGLGSFPLCPESQVQNPESTRCDPQQKWSCSWGFCPRRRSLSWFCPTNGSPLASPRLGHRGGAE